MLLLIYRDKYFIWIKKLTNYSHTFLLATTLLLQPLSSSAETIDCTQSKFLAQQAFTMLKAGASLDVTLKSFEPTPLNKYMIKKLFDNKKIIRNISNAEKSGLKSCKFFS